MKRILLFAALAGLLAACGQQQHTPDGQATDAIGIQQNVPGDSTHYGLACDGCTDSILVFLPYSGGDPDTFDIIDARQHHRIYGRPHIGDELAVMLNPEDSAEALMVVNMEALKGTWCYLVEPKLRNVDQMPQRMQRRMMERMPDSLRELMMKPREYTLRLKRDNTAMHYGGMRRQTTTDNMSPVEFPSVKRYTEWRMYNGRLILKADTISGFTADGDVPQTDTATIELLMRDSLVLRFKEHTQSFYRKEGGES
jgi:hypothetical protein